MSDQDKQKAIDEWIAKQDEWSKEQMKALALEPPPDSDSWPSKAGYWLGYSIALAGQRKSLEAEVARLKQKLFERGDVLP